MVAPVSEHEVRCRVTHGVSSWSGPGASSPRGDLAELPDLGNALNEQIAWRHESARLDQ